jgi:glyoxylase-like metal-dependent hydrolase (beta-lactamase superfamily II)
MKQFLKKKPQYGIFKGGVILKLDVILPGSTIWIPERVQGSYSTVAMLYDESHKILIDPSHEGSMRFLEEQFNERNLKPEEITEVLLTHFHLDHAANSKFFKNASVYVHEKYRNKPYSNFGIFSGQAYQEMYDQVSKRDILIKDGDRLFDCIDVIYTPYHSSEHCSFFVETDNMGKVFFPGDICMTRIELYDVLRGLRTDKVAEIVKEYYDKSDYIIFTHDSPYRIDK